MNFKKKAKHELPEVETRRDYIFGKGTYIEITKMVDLLFDNSNIISKGEVGYCKEKIEFNRLIDSYLTEFSINRKFHLEKIMSNSEEYAFKHRYKYTFVCIREALYEAAKDRNLTKENVLKECRISLKENGIDFEL